MTLDFLIATVLTILGFIATLIGSYYARHSYLLTLKNYEKDKKRSEKAKHYYETYINIPPSKKVSAFLKKVDSDDLNDGVLFPTIFTDFIMKNFPDRYFYIASLFKKCWSQFEITENNNQIQIKCKIKYFYSLQFGYFCLYLLFAMCIAVLGLYNDLIISKLSDDSPWGALYIIFLGILFSVIFMFGALFKTTQITDAKKLNKEFKKVLPPT